MTDKEALRQTGLNDSNAFGEKRRFGLFSQPISTAIGDDGPYKTKLRRTIHYVRSKRRWSRKTNYLNKKFLFWTMPIRTT